MFSRLKQWAFGAFVAVAFALSVIGALGQCSKPVAPANDKRVDSVLVVRHDTIKVIDSVLKTRIKWIDTSKITVVHDTFNVYAPEDSTDIANDDTQVITDHQLRTAMKWKDSLQNCQDSRKVDSVTIDTLGKLARKVDTVKPPITQRLKDIGVGVLVGIGVRSLF